MTIAIEGMNQQAPNAAFFASGFGTNRVKQEPPPILGGDQVSSSYNVAEGTQLPGIGERLNIRNV